MPTSRKAVSSPLSLLLALGAGLSGCDAASDARAASERAPAVAVVPPDAGVPDFGALPNPYTMTEDWGAVPPGRSSWGRVSAVAMDNDGVHVWMAERCGGDVCLGKDDPVVLEYAPDGSLVKSFGGGLFMRPHGMYVDSADNVWVTDVRSPTSEELESSPADARKGHQVVKFSPDGEVLMVLGTPGEAGDPADGKLNEPNDVVTTPNGDIYVAEGHAANGPSRISRFRADGTFVSSFGETGTGPGQFRVPHALALDGRGHLLVADRSNSRVQIFDLAGHYLSEWHQFGWPNDVFVSRDGKIFTIDSGSDPELNPGYRRGVYIGDARTGEVTAFIPGHPVEDDPLGTAGEGIVMAADGTLYAGEVILGGMTRYARK